ncbi:MAG: GNAT family N-acetyltransferase [Candidatus Micrarchaeia archaeon]
MAIEGVSLEEEVKREEGRFYIKTEHGEAELLYRIDGSIMEVFHTFTPPQDRGKGIAEKLANAALGFAKLKGVKIKPECTYMQFFFYKHPDLKIYEEPL